MCLLKDKKETRNCRFFDLGQKDFEEVYGRQKECLDEAVKDKECRLIICEHPPVFTLGRLADGKNILATPEKISARHAKVLKIDRGGDVTFHGPGQLVSYPIFPLEYFGKDLKLFLSRLEKVAIDFLAAFGIMANRVEGRRGVFTPQGKIASMAIGVKQWVSFHGMAVNVNTDLSYFAMIRPCGLDVAVTSVEALLGSRVELQESKKILRGCYGKEFALTFK